jgi:hypothetical protein
MRDDLPPGRRTRSTPSQHNLLHRKAEGLHPVYHILIDESYRLHDAPNDMGRPVLKPMVAEASALGAAIMASIGLGYYEDLDKAVTAMVKEKREDRCYPDPSLHHLYARIQSLFNQVYASLEPALAQHQQIWKGEA